MAFIRYKPGSILRRFVACFWYFEGDGQQGHTHERLMPNGEATIIINLREDAIRVYHPTDLNRFETFGTALFSGARSHYFVIDTAQQDRVLGIQFRAGGAYPFFRIPAGEAENTSIRLDELWKHRSELLRERLLGAPDAASMFQIAEECLLAELFRPLHLHPAVEFALTRFYNQPHIATVTSVTEKIGLSPRHFVEVFRNEVGMTPKTFCRVRRFQRAIHSAHGRQKVNWTELALDCGYYDQAHFIHDFQSFSGLTPTAYWAAATDHLNHVPIV
jgi:AraC-like DNA-binding protein